MTVQRESKRASQFDTEDRREASWSGVGASGSSKGATVVGGSDGRQFVAALGRLGGIAEDGLNKLADLHYRNRYLEGQAKAGLIESEKEIQGNPMTRDWELAGYRDTMGKLALADQKARIQADMSDLRKKDRAGFEEYLKKRREDFLPAFNSMSREQQAAMAGQMALQDRADTQTWATEHSKYIIEEKSAAVATLWGTALQGVHTAQMQYHLGEIPREGLDAQIRSTVGNLVGAVWLDASLPREVQQSLTSQAFQMALANDSVELYDFMANTVMDDAGFTGTTLLSRLPQKEQDKLGDQYRAARQRTSDARNLAYMQDVAKLEAQVADGAYQGTHASLTEFLNPLVVRGVITGERSAAIQKQFLRAKKAEADVSTLGAAAIRGDLNAIFGTGHSIEQGVEAVDKLLFKAGADHKTRMETYARMGLNGMDAGWKKLGTQVGVAARAMRNPAGEILSQHRDTFQMSVDFLQQAEQKGQSWARAALLSGMPEADRAFVERLYHKVTVDGKSYEQAHQEASRTEELENKLTPSAKAALSANASRASVDIVQEMGTVNPLEYGWNAVKGAVAGLFGEVSPAQLENKTAPYSSFSGRDGFLGDSAYKKLQAQNYREELLQSVESVKLSHPYSSPEELKTLALGELLGRTIQTEYGPVYSPQGTTIQGIFGVSGPDTPYVAKAIERLVKAGHPETSGVVLKFSGDVLQVQSVDKDGNPDTLETQHISAQDIQAEIKKLNDARDKYANEVYGSGRRVKGKGGSSVTFNGVNNAGVQEERAYAVRNSLVHFEGVTNTPYPDGKGHSVGVGINTSNGNYPLDRLKDASTLKASDAQINESFRKASDEALRAATGILQDSGIPENTVSLALVTHMVYQAGPKFASQNTPSGRASVKMLSHAVNGNKQKALNELRKTAAYKVSPKARKAFYEQLIEAM